MKLRPISNFMCMCIPMLDVIFFEEYSCIHDEDFILSDTSMVWILDGILFQCHLGMYTMHKSPHWSKIVLVTIQHKVVLTRIHKDPFTSRHPPNDNILLPTYTNTCNHVAFANKLPSLSMQITLGVKCTSHKLITLLIHQYNNWNKNIIRVCCYCGNKHPK